MPTTRIENLKRTLTSQFGGYSGGSGGSSTSGHAPGGSPISKNGQGSGNFNAFFPDQAFDTMLNSTRHDDDRFGDETNTTEKKLSKLHANAEQDAINYQLTDKERERLKIKQQVYEREKYAKESLDNFLKNTPAYIKSHFTPKPETMRTMEESLLARHLNNETRSHPRENTLPEQEHPQLDEVKENRIGHSRIEMLRSAIAPTHGRSTVFDVDPDEEPDKSIANPWARQYDSSYMGGYGQSGDVVMNQQDYEKSIEGGDQAKQSYQPFDAYEPLAFKYPGSDSTHSLGGPSSVEDTPSSLPKHKDNSELSLLEEQDSNAAIEDINNTNAPIEDRLRRLKVQKTPKRLPNFQFNAFDGFDNNADFFGQDGEFSKYDSSGADASPLTR